MYKIVLVRHGESVWNKENRFTGWKDVDLSEKGLQEAKDAAGYIKQAGLTFDKAHTSVLRRAIRTLWIIQDNLDLMWTPVDHSWRLNERHYGALQGLNKSETAEKYGEQQVLVWRRSYDVLPPLLAESDPEHPSHDPKYKGITGIPAAESLKTTVDRMVPYWKEAIIPDLKAGKKLLVAAHGNSIRALIKYLENMSEKEIMEINIPTGIPLVYELKEDFSPIKRYYLADEEKVKSAIASVAKQGKKK